jgi:hypothetical protein
MMQKNDDLKLVNNSPEYYDFIRKLRNHPKIKKNFIQQTYISASQQVKYMKKHQKDYYICLLDDVPAGYIGVIDGDIRIAVLPEFQNKGVGLFLIKNIQKKYKNLQAKIKIKNQVSIQLFKEAGFKLKYYIFE